MNTKKLITICLFVLFIFVFWFRHRGLNQLWSGVWASEEVAPAITIAPSILDLDVERGSELTDDILVTNDSEWALPIKVEVNDYTVDEQGVPDYAEDTSGWSPRTWIKIDPADLILSPSEQREVILTFTIPEYAQHGSHFATVLFKPVLPPEYFEQDSTPVIPYIGAIVSLNVSAEELEEKINYLEIKEFQKGESEDAKSEEEFYSKVYNDDVYYHKVNGQIVIKNIFNKEVATKSIEDVTLFPGKVRSVTSFLDHDLAFGRYKAELYLSDKSTEVSSSLVFWESPTIGEIILIILRIVLILVVIVGVVLLGLKRKNLKRALKTLFSQTY